MTTLDLSNLVPRKTDDQLYADRDSYREQLAMPGLSWDRSEIISNKLDAIEDTLAQRRNLR